KDLIATFEIGSSESLAAVILDARKNTSTYKERAARAKAWFNETFDETRAVQPLLEWAAAPSHSRDRSSLAEDSTTADHQWLSELSRIQYGAVSDTNGDKTHSKRTAPETVSEAPKKKKLFGLFGRKN